MAAVLPKIGPRVRYAVMQLGTHNLWSRHKTLRAAKQAANRNSKAIGARDFYVWDIDRKVESYRTSRNPIMAKRRTSRNDGHRHHPLGRPTEMNPRRKAAAKSSRCGVYVKGRLAYVSLKKLDCNKAATKLRSSGRVSITIKAVNPNPITGKLPKVGWRTEFKKTAYAAMKSPAARRKQASRDTRTRRTIGRDAKGHLVKRSPNSVRSSLLGGRSVSRFSRTARLEKGAGLEVMKLKRKGPDGGSMSSVKVDRVLKGYVSKIMGGPSYEAHPWKTWSAVVGQGPARAGNVTSTHRTKDEAVRAVAGRRNPRRPTPRKRNAASMLIRRERNTAVKIRVKRRGGQWRTGAGPNKTTLGKIYQREANQRGHQIIGEVMNSGGAWVKWRTFKPAKSGRNPTHFRGKLGTGTRFANCVSDVRKGLKGKKKSSRAAAVCASIGRKKYGAKKFSKLSTAGRKNPKRRKGAAHAFEGLLPGRPDKYGVFVGAAPRIAFVTPTYAVAQRAAAKLREAGYAAVIDRVPGNFKAGWRSGFKSKKANPTRKGIKRKVAKPSTPAGRKGYAAYAGDRLAWTGTKKPDLSKALMKLQDGGRKGVRGFEVTLKGAGMGWRKGMNPVARKATSKAAPKRKAAKRANPPATSATGYKYKVEASGGGVYYARKLTSAIAKAKAVARRTKRKVMVSKLTAAVGRNPRYQNHSEVTASAR